MINLRFNWHLRKGGGLLIGAGVHAPFACYYKNPKDRDPRWCLTGALHLLVCSVHIDVWLWRVRYPDGDIRNMPFSA